jgi:phospholipase/carboxylesterase
MTKIVMFHGYGANGADLAPLAGEIETKTKFDWEFPDAPLRLPYGGLAWFQIDVEAINRAQTSGVPVDFSGSDARDLTAAREEGFRIVASLKVPWKDVVLGGFSQGSMLAVDLALRAPEPPRGLVVMSGNLINSKDWAALAPKRKGLRFFQSHGLADPILGHRGAVRLNELLNGAGLEGKLLSFEGGHAIPPEVLAGIGGYLDSLS